MLLYSGLYHVTSVSRRNKRNKYIQYWKVSLCSKTNFRRNTHSARLIIFLDCTNSVNSISLCIMSFQRYSICITNNSVRYQSFVYSQLNEQTVLFQTFQFSKWFVCTQLNVKHFYLTYSTNRVLPLLIRVELGAMAVKACSTFPKAPVLLEPHHLIV